MNNFKKLHLVIIVVFMAIMSIQSLNAATKLSGTLTSSLGAYGTTTESYPLTNANDGDLTSYFWSNATPVANDYLLFTLNATAQIGDIKFVFANNDQPNGVVVEVSEDNSVWEEVATFGNSDISASPYTYVCNAEAKVAKYVRLRFSESATGWVKVTEFQVYEYSSTPTLSLTAETEIPYYWTPQNFVVDYVVDGDVDSYFFSSRNLATGDYITLTLAQESTISDIKLTFMNGDQPNGSVIEISNDKSDWTQVASFNKSDISTTDYTYSCSLSNAVAKYVRLRFTEASDGWFKLAEFEVIPGETAPIPSRTITVTSSPAEGGTVTANNVEGGVTAEGAITLKAESSDNYKFVRWTLEGETVSSTTTYTDREEGDKEYIAEFVALTAEEKYALLCTPVFTHGGNNNNTYITAATIKGESIEVPETQTNGDSHIQEGVTASIPVSAGEEIALDLTFTVNWGDINIFQIVNDNTDVDVIYGPYDGTWPDGTEPLGEMANDNISVNGTTASFPIQFGEDLKVGDIVVVRVVVGNDVNTPCPSGLTEGGYVDFLFEIAGGYVAPKYAVSAEASPAEGGQVTISANEVEANSTVSLTATANEGYDFVNWTVNGTEVSVDANFTSAAITAETEFVANFKAREYNVVYKVDGEDYQTVPTAFGSTITPIAEPEKEGYTFSGWSEIPETMPASDVEVTGTFTKNVYAVSVSVNNPAYGSVSPETANVEHGETITLTATANLGYQFVGWFEGGRNISNETNFSIIITSDKNYEATFEAIDKVNVTVVDENRTETKSTVYANVTVGNEKVWDVQANTILADKVSVSVDADGVASEVKIADGGQITTVLEITRTIEKGKWALMSLPFAVDLANVTVDGVAAVNNSNIKVMVYDAAYRAANSIELFTKSGWKELTGTTIAANQGFAVAINANNGDEQKVTFTATSQTYDGTDKQISLSRYASTVNEGADADWNFYGNPTLAKAQKGTGYALYVYNAEDDSYDEYASSDVATYQPYAAWFVQSADDFNAMSFSAGVAGALAEADGVFGELQFSLNGDDEARIVLVDESSEEYVRNEDALYFPAINTNLSQLYLVKGNIKMAVSEQPSLTSMAMGYKAVKSGEQTLTLTSVPENTSVVLVDNVAGTETAMTLGDTYTFQSEAGTFNNRFVIETTDLTGISQAVADGEVKVLVSGTEINVYGAEAGTEVVAYTTNGTVVASAVAEEGVTTLSTSATGVIIIRVAEETIKVVK
ncbi:MAG: discoidin domain-containing protein [Bacteroidales bacterium]|nr:discoidin domain-containing protein [Bacteroidales bacterium]